MTRQRPPARSASVTLRDAIRKAIAATPSTAADVAAFERGDRASSALRDSAELFRRFFAAQLPAEGGEFLWCARQLGISSHPALLIEMSRENRRRVQDESGRRLAHAEMCHARNVESHELLHERGHVTAAALERMKKDDGFLRRCRGEYRAVVLVQSSAASPPPPTVVVRAARERRPRRRQTQHVARSTSSSDPGDDGESEPAAERFCPGCGRDISHRRRGAKTCGAACRKRVERGAGLEQLLVERTELWQEATTDGGRRDLTYRLDRELEEIAAERRLRQSRATTPRPTELDSLSVARWVMETNGTCTGYHRGSPWSQSVYALRTRPAIAA